MCRTAHAYTYSINCRCCSTSDHTCSNRHTSSTDCDVYANADSSK